jgi:hypothetical protein
MMKRKKTNMKGKRKGNTSRVWIMVDVIDLEKIKKLLADILS